MTVRNSLRVSLAGVLALALAAPALAAQPASAPAIKPAPVATTPIAPPAGSSPPPGATASNPATDPVLAPPPVAPPIPPAEPVLPWTLADAGALLKVIQGIDAEGLIPADYAPAALKAAILNGEGADLDAAASKSFAWLAEDLRDGRTPMKARVQWFAIDNDVEVNPTDKLLTAALTSHDVPGTLAALAPTYPDYAALKAQLAVTPKADLKTRALVRANMDRWRWFSRDLGEYYLMTNVPEYQLRLVRKDRIVRTYRTIVGKPGKTATPQLAEVVEGVVFNPTWTVPQSIVKGEGLGAKILANPDPARNGGYKATKGADGFVTVVQQPGPGNSLGLMKLDMPNAHAIFLHDTPARGLFNTAARALSHGCVRTERAKELAITMAIIGAGKTPEEALAISDSGTYTKVALTKQMPVYIGYFTYAKDINGKLAAQPDIYQRDAPVLASFTAARQIKTGQRTSSEKVVALEDAGL